MPRKDPGPPPASKLPQINNGRATPQPSSTGTSQLPIRPIGFLYTQPARTAKESIFSFFKPGNGGASKKRRENAAANGAAADDENYDELLRPASAGSSISRPQSRSGAPASSETPQLMRSHWHDNDVIDRLKQVAKEIGISIQVPQAKKLDLHAIKEQAARNLEDLKVHLERGSSGGEAAAAAEKKQQQRPQPAMRPEKLVEIEEEKLHRTKSYERELNQKRLQMEKKLDEMQKLSIDLEKRTDPSEELQAAMLAVNKEGLMIKVRDLTLESERLDEEGDTYRHMQRRLEGFVAAERVMCDEIGRQIQQHDEDLVKLRERLRDSVKEITGSLHVDDMEHARLLMQVKSSAVPFALLSPMHSRDVGLLLAATCLFFSRRCACAAKRIVTQCNPGNISRLRKHAEIPPSRASRSAGLR
jgi:hypothetical protein